MPSTRTEQPTELDAPAVTGLTITVRTGAGTGQTPLSAFDRALLDAGVGDFNLVTLSSVIPPASRLRHVDAPLAGTHGDLLFCVRAEAYADRPGHEAWAGLGWVTDRTGAGLFVEHHGVSEASVVDQIERSLEDMNRARGDRYGLVQMTLSSARCVDEPACALVVAAYRVMSWHDDSHTAPAPPPEQGLVPAPPAASPGASSGPGGTHSQVTEDWIAEDHAVPASTNGISTNGISTNGISTNGIHPPAAPGISPPRGGPDGWPAVVARVSVEKEIDFATAKRYYKLYLATFGALDAEAAGRQLLSEDEFLEEMLDPRVLKYVAWDHDDLAIAMSTLATDPETLPWVSPTYFAHHYPEEYAAGKVFYLGFTLVHPQHRGSGIFRLLLREVMKFGMEQGGVAAWDSCQANDERGMNKAAMRVIEELTGVTPEPIDRQTYYAFRLPEVGEVRDSATAEG